MEVNEAKKYRDNLLRDYKQAMQAGQFKRAKRLLAKLNSTKKKLKRIGRR